MNISQLRSMALHDDGMEVIKTSYDGMYEYVQNAYTVEVVNVDDIEQEYEGMEFNGHYFDILNIPDDEGTIISDFDYVVDCIVDWLFDAGAGMDLRNPDGTWTREWNHEFHKVAYDMAKELPWQEVLVID